MAARSVWTGSVSFGLVTVPVKLYKATTEKTIAFRSINSATGNPIKMPKVDSETGEPAKDILKGYELTKGRFVTIQPEELEAIAPKQTKTLSLEEFVPIEQIDPLIYDASYYIGPADAAAQKAYRLLVKVMQDANTVGIGRIILRSKQKLVALRSLNGVLVCSTLVFPDEINRPNDCVQVDDNAPEPSDKEIKMGMLLIESMIEDFDHSKYRDTYRDQVVEMINAKAAGETFTPAADQAEDEAPDLMKALEMSLQAKPKKQVTKKTKKTKKVTA